MGFYEKFGNSQWKVSTFDDQISSLIEGNDEDKFEKILDILRNNKKYYLLNGTTEDEWTNRILFFAWQRDISIEGVYPERYILAETGTDKLKLENDDFFIIQNEPRLSLDYMNDKDVSWFNSEIRCDIATKLLIKIINEKFHSLYHGESAIFDNENVGLTDDQVSNLSWLSSEVVNFYNKMTSLSYSKYFYFTKLCSIHIKYTETIKKYTEIDNENSIAISNLNNTELTDLLSFVRDTYVEFPDDHIKKNDLETACQMLEFDMAQ